MKKKVNQQNKLIFMELYRIRLTRQVKEGDHIKIISLT